MTLTIVIDMNIEVVEDSINQYTELDPILLIGFDRNVQRINLETPTQTQVDVYETGRKKKKKKVGGERIRLTGKITDPNSIVEASCVAVLVIGDEDQNNVPCYRRGSEALIGFVNDLSQLEKEESFECIMTNHMKETLLILKITILASKVYGDETHMKLYESISDQASNERVQHIINSVVYEQKYDKQMFRYFKRHFPFIFETTETMTLWNDNFGFDGKTLFYQFLHAPLQSTNAEFWNARLDIALDLKYGIECIRRNISKREFYKTLDPQELAALYQLMICVTTIAARYIPDYVKSQRMTTDSSSPLGLSSEIPTKGTIKYIEDFCAMHYSWSGDCEDSGPQMSYEIKTFLSCSIDSTKYPELAEIQELGFLYRFFPTLWGVSKASTESTTETSSAHASGVAFLKEFFGDLKVHFPNSSGDDRDEDNSGSRVSLRDKQEHNFYRPESEMQKSFRRIFKSDLHRVPDKWRGKLPNVLIFEGTGFVKGVLNKRQQIPIRLKNYTSLPFSVREPIEMIGDRITFYQYALEILTNDAIDGGKDNELNIQSFILTYNPARSIEIDSENTLERRQNLEFQYGVRVQDILTNPECIELVATPEIDPKALQDNILASRHKLNYPICYLKSNGSPLEDYTTIKRHPIASKEYLQKEIRQKYSRFISDDDGGGGGGGLVPSKDTITSQRRLLCLCPPPIVLTDTINIIANVLGTSKLDDFIHKIEIRSLFQTLDLVILWVYADICLDKLNQ